MKKTTKIYSRLQSPSSKLLKRKKKITTCTDQLQIIQEKKFNVYVQFNYSTKKSDANFKFTEGKPLVEVKKQILENLKKLKHNVEQIIGFQTLESNYAFDYKFQNGFGKLEQNLRLKCLYFENKKGLEKYIINCCLAIGGFSKVFLVRSKLNGKFYAAKFIDKSKKQLINQCLLQNQKQISLKLNSPFLVKTHQFIQNNQFYVFIMDYCPGGQLFYLLKQIKCMTEQQARICFIQILLGIEQLHKAGYMYRDLKPENILLDQYGFMKIADFGLAKLYSQKSYSFCGSVQYMAPQIIRGKGHNKYVDFYCLGALLYQLLVGHPPFYDSRLTVQQTKAKIIFNNIKFPKILDLSSQVKDLIEKLTSKNERQRLGYFGGCKQIMAHPWIGKIDKKSYDQRKILPPFKVNLDKLNFDPQQIGQSERRFEEKINQVIQQSSKNTLKRQNKYNSLKLLTKLQKSHSHKSLIKRSKSPYNSKSLITNSFSIQNKNSKSPYQKIMKNSKSMKSVKRLKTEQKQQFVKKKASEKSNRWTQSQGASKQNKMLNTISKLRKKFKYVPFNTTVDNNLSPLKMKGSSNEKVH